MPGRRLPVGEQGMETEPPSGHSENRQSALMPLTWSETRPLRIIVAAAEPMFRRGLIATLDGQPGFDPHSEADTVEGAAAESRRSEVSVVFLDGGLVARSPDRALTALRLAHLKGRVILLSREGDDALCLAALRAGARGCVSKKANDGAIVSAVAVVAQGGVVLTPSLRRSLLDAVAARDVISCDLTPRQRAVLRLVAEGCPNGEIAASLSVSTATVKSELQATFRTLSVSDRTAAVVEALRHGLLDLGSLRSSEVAGERSA
jgi:DNA-binding NarL/FixJ family response regulator